MSSGGFLINANRLLQKRGLLLIAVATTLIAIAVRLYGLDLRGLTHPEIYVPGIDLIPGISEPPPRFGLGETLWWHFHDEPHPIGWYLAMRGWTALAGTSEWALRFPSVLFAAASVPLMLALGRHVFGPAAGALAALLLALHGFHLFWSQNARMYVAGVFLGLLATWLLLRLAAAREPRPRVELSYVLTCVAGVQTVELFWPVLLLHTAWVALFVTETRQLDRTLVLRPHLQGPRLIRVQSIALMLAAPALLHALYRARAGAAEWPEPGFLGEYFGFGFLFAHDESALPVLGLPTSWAFTILVAGMLLLAMSLRARTFQPYRSDPFIPGFSGWIAPVVAVAVAIFMAWLALIAHRRAWVLLFLAILPIAALALPALAVVVRTWLARFLPFADRGLRALDPSAVLLWLLGVFAPIALYVSSHVVSVLAPRAFLIFVPFLVILMVAGALSFPGRVFRAGAAAGLVLLFAASLPYVAHKPGSPRDYKKLSQQMIPRMQPEDIVLIRKRNWADTPFFYYVPDAHYVAEDFAAALAAHPESRIWLVTWPDEEQPVITDDRLAALSNHQKVEQIDALRARAELFVKGAEPQ